MDTILFIDGFGFSRGWYVATDDETVMAGPYDSLGAAERAARAGSTGLTWRPLPPRRPAPVINPKRARRAAQASRIQRPRGRLTPAT